REPHGAQPHPAHRAPAARDGVRTAVRHPRVLPGTQMTDLRAASAGADGGRAAALEPHDPALSGIRILVVDDDLGVCQSLRDLLTQEGCEVLVATGGREGIARLETTVVDLVL